MILSAAIEIAARVQAALAPHCSHARCVVAGSVRRKKPEVKDIEIVCIPEQAPTDLWGGALQASQGWIDAVNQWPAVKGSPLGRYTQRVLPEGVNLDIFMTRFEDWGLTLAVRTGPADFSRGLAQRCTDLGFRMREGALWRYCDRVMVPQERDFFDLLKLPWLEPEARA